MSRYAGENEMNMSPETLASLLSGDALSYHVRGTDLTPAEQKVLRLLADGYDHPTVAQKLGKSFETVKAQSKLARARLGARNTTHAVAIAISLDMI